MIHFHGGPITPDTCALKAWKGRHAFVSFANPGQINLASEVTQSFALDNGAFSFWTKNRVVDWNEYYRFVERWGTWVKLNQNAELRINKALSEGEVTDFYDFLDLLNAETRMNGGNHTRANTEDLLIATRGAGLERKHAGIKQVVYSPLGAHSEKPWEVRHRLELLYGDVPRIELFSRSAAPGWHHWGNQCATAAVELLPGCAIDVVKTEAA